MKRIIFPLTLLAILLVGCGRSDQKAPAKPAYLHTWARTNYQAGGGDAMVSFVLYGRFKEGSDVSAKEYRTAGFPPGVALQHLTRAQQTNFPGTDEAFAKTVGKDNPALFKQIQEAPECLVFQGVVRDPRDLDFLRDLVGLSMFSLDHGATVLMDVQQLKLYDPATWRKEIFEPDPPNLSQHVAILVSEETGGTRWFHTRGMRKFGRPDLSIHQVSKDLEGAVTELLNRFILLEAQGGVIPEGKQIEMAGLPSGLSCHHAGTPADQDFNNVHVEIRWPEKK